MKVKHLLGIFGILIVILVVGCGGGNSGLVNVNSNQVYTTGGYTLDASIARPAVSNTAVSH